MSITCQIIIHYRITILAYKKYPDLKKFILSYLSLLILFSAQSKAQEINNLRCRDILVQSDTIVFDTLSIIPGTIFAKFPDGDIIDDSIYKIDNASARIFFYDTSSLNNKHITLCYRHFPYNFSKKYYNKSPDLIVKEGSRPYNPFTFKQSQLSRDIFEFDGLNKSGSISRAINFGNNQDIVVNSNLNLQLSGKLGREIEILAAITDNSMPIQPYGNTQYIQEFDKVFIQLSARKTQLIAGDFELEQPNSYFMNYYKKVQGGDIRTSFNPGKDSETSMNLHIAGALSKGKFARNTLQAMEGNQGPYKLKGNENEIYIIVLAGTEKVYIDGKLLLRGENNDYIIDYNTAEITFTPNILITKDKRIIVEFEYSDKNYSRSLYYAGSELEIKTGPKKKNILKLGFNFFSEQDLKNQSLQQDLTAEQRYLLSQIGDSIENAYVKRIDSVGYSTDEVLYIMKDTVVNTQYYDSVFVYPETPDSNAVYRVGFTFLGANRGNYIQETNAVNGRVYKWIAPVDSIPQGEYEPVSLLISPKKSQMFNISAEYLIADKTNFKIEFVLSNRDINTFSKLDASNNKGYGIKTEFKKIINLSPKRDTNDSWSLITKLDYEWINKNFNPIEPYRQVEFNRDWNRTSDEVNADEQMSTISVALENRKTGFANYSFQLYQDGSRYNAHKNNLNTSFKKRGFLFSAEGSLLKTKDIEYQTRFLRSRALLSKRLGKIIVGIENEQENNRFSYNHNDSIMPNSYSFNEFEVFVTNPDTAKNRYKGFYRQRTDKAASMNMLKNASNANELGFSMKIFKNVKNRINFNATYRNLKISDTSLTEQKSENNIVGRIEYMTKQLEGLLTLNVFYEIGSGQELKKEFSYLKVPDGEGIYKWTDYNEDGIKQLNEFEVAKFKDQASYIRIYLPTTDYIRTYFNKYSNSLNLRPAAIIRNPSAFMKAVARFSNQTIYQVEHNSTSDDPIMRFNPFIGEEKFSDSVLISMSSSFRNTLYYNRNNSKFGIDISFQHNKSKVLLVNGFETRIFKSMFSNLRWKFNSYSTIFLDYKRGKNISKSDFFSSRDFNIVIDEIQPKLSWQPNSTIILDLFYNYKRRANDPEQVIDSLPDEQSHIQKLGIEINYKVVNKGNLQFALEYLHIAYNASENTPLAYEMLEGFGKGNNASWNLAYQMNLSKYLQLNLVYSGRKTEDVKTIHMGSVQLRAYF